MRNKIHALGQHMLIDRKIIDYEVEIIKPAGKRVLEIGGGNGNLSVELTKASFLTIVEIDEEFVKILNEKLGDCKNVKIIKKDFLDLTPKEVGDIDIIVGNIPYALSSKILFKLLDYNFEYAVLCFQKEFAERMIAKAGTSSYSRLSVMTQLYFRPILLKTVSKGCFRPVPKVNSAIVYLSKTNESVNKERDKIIKKLFSHKKKNILSALKSNEFSDEEKERIKKRINETKIGNKKVFQLDVKDIKLLLS